ncbi:hypothetical protein VMCG_04018 [Cytospora schulzeri]|uniref:Glycoside hydrolase 131 catalytic N-terminal domain-containing protein n=1 Tax=Cytospora schulzeri TaxID=448051 RepID=A0A423WUA1_9PEZI|nr:hypothetical protein VMCG_04018 [Valsa malicola]
MGLISLAALAASLVTVNAGTILWDGRFNDLTSSTDLDNWSWSNEVGPYQYYIHGSGDVTEYVNLSPSYKNPADTSSKQGVKITLDSTAYWEGQTMRRTELIPQTTAAINTGTVWYHFSMLANATNYPSIYREHQIAFFESHFTEMKSGWISGESATSDANLQWMVGGTSKWATNLTAGVWHNVAYEIDFSAGTVGFWHSTGGDDLVLAVEPVAASTSSNGADWHLGVLELPRDGYVDADEDFYFSGVYVEGGGLTTGVSGPGGGGSSGSSSSSSSSAVASSTATSSRSTTLSTSTVSTTSKSASSVSTASSATASSTCSAANVCKKEGSDDSQVLEEEVY